MVFLDSSPEQIRDEDQLVQRVASEMDQVKRDRMGLTLSMAVAIMMRLRVFGMILRSSMCMTTITNEPMKLTTVDSLVAKQV